MQVCDRQVASQEPCPVQAVPGVRVAVAGVV